MSEYRLAHVALTCMAVFVVIESAMIALFRDYGLMTTTNGVFTPIPIDGCSYFVWLALGTLALVLREPLCRLCFRRGDGEEPRERFRAMYCVGARLLSVALLIVFGPHLALVPLIEDLDPGFSDRILVEWDLVIADGAVVLFALGLWGRPGLFARLAMLGSRR